MQQRQLLLLLLIMASIFALDCRPRAHKDGAQIRVSRETIRLLAAATQGDISEMDAAIKAGADVNGSDGIVGPALVAAASGGNREAVKFLLEKGANVNATDSEGMTALMMATMSGSDQTVEYLLGKGANPNASTMIGIVSRDQRTMKHLLSCCGMPGRKNNSIGVTEIVRWRGKAYPFS